MGSEQPYLAQAAVGERGGEAHVGHGVLQRDVQHP